MMGKLVSQRERTPWRGGLAALVGTPALTIWGVGGIPDPLDPESRWPLGYSMDPITCVEGWRWDPSCGFQATTQVDDETGEIVVVVDQPKPDRADLCPGKDEFPFGIGTSSGCSILNIDDPVAEYQQKVEDAYLLAVWRQIAAELWSGDIIRNQVATGSQDELSSFLTNDEDAAEDCGFDLLADGDVVGLSEALFELDYYLISNSNDSAGVIHCDWKTLWRWVDAELLEPEGAFRWKTKVGGFFVVAEPLYPGTGPASTGFEAPTDEFSWAYATGPLQVRIHPPEVFPPVDSRISEKIHHSQNHIRFVAEGLASLTWTCSHAGIRVATTETVTPAVE